MAIDNCIFCGHYLKPAGQNKPHSRTAEHIFAAWFRRISRYRMMNMYLGTVSGSDSTQFIRRPSLTSLKMKGVCRACNNGWMSALETAAEPVMVRVFGGDTGANRYDVTSGVNPQVGPLRTRSYIFVVYLQLIFRKK